MTDFHFRDQHGENIYQADQININLPPARVDHAAMGVKALRARNYESARRRLTEAIDLHPDDQELNYLLALALLNGQRPHMHHRNAIDQIKALLSHARELLPEALALWLLVKGVDASKWEPGVRSTLAT